MAAPFAWLVVSLPFAGWLAVLAGCELVDGVGVFCEPGMGGVDEIGVGAVLGVIVGVGVGVGVDDTGGEAVLEGDADGVPRTGGDEPWVRVRDDPSELHCDGAGAGADA